MTDNETEAARLRGIRYQVIQLILSLTAAGWHGEAAELQRLADSLGVAAQNVEKETEEL